MQMVAMESKRIETSETVKNVLKKRDAEFEAMHGTQISCSQRDVHHIVQSCTKL